MLTLAELQERPWLYELDAALFAVEAEFGRARVLDGTAVRYRGWASFAFPPAEFLSCEPPTDAEPGTLAFSVPMLSLFGATGTLPPDLTREMLRAEEGPDADPALREFLDVFNHRLVALYGIAASSGTPWDGGDGGRAGDPGDAITRFLSGMIGFGRVAGVPLEFFARNAAILLVPPSVAAMEDALSDHFDAPVRVASRGEALGPDDESPDDFLMVVGPVAFDRYRQFLPSGNALGPLARLVRLFVGAAPRFGVRLLLDPPSRPDLRLDAEGPGGYLLDWAAWSDGGEGEGRTLEGLISAEACARAEITEI